MHEPEWAEYYFIDIDTLRECDTYVKDMHLRLKRLKLEASDTKETKWTDTENTVILKVVIFGAFYPNYFLLKSPFYSNSECEIWNELKGHNPTKTVFVTFT